MPLANDPGTPTRTIKPPPKKRTTKTTKPAIIGPVAPQVAAAQSPTRVYGPTISPSLPRAPKVQSPTPSYTKAVFEPRKAPVVSNPDAFKSSGDLTGFIRGLKAAPKDDVRNILAGADHDVKPESALNFLLNPQRTMDEQGYKEDYDELTGRREEMQRFLSKIMPQGYDPEYGGVQMPEDYKHLKNNPKLPLKPHWDAKEIASNLSDFEPGSSFARFAMNDILEKQLRNQSNWVKRQTVSRAYRVADILKEAESAAFDGDFNYLAEKLEKNPDLLEFAKYKDEYTVGPDEIWNRWEQERNQYNSDPYIKAAMRARTDDLKSHYEYVRKWYTDARTVANRAIKKYEVKYNRSVEIAENQGGKKAAFAKEAGPAIPEAKNEDKSLLDRAANEFPSSEGSTLYLSDKDQAKRRLGVSKLPSVKEMLSALVSQGQIDPESDAELDAWIRRLQNPNHPDTRAMYASFARLTNKKLDDKDALAFINEPIDSFVKGEEEKERLRVERIAKTQERGTALAAGTALDILKNPTNAFSPEGVAESIVDSAVDIETDSNNKGAVAGATGLMWTFDKLARASYAVAGTADAWNKLDQDDSSKATPWYGSGIPGPFGFVNAPINLLMGKNLGDSVDEVWKDPSKLAEPAKAGYQQFFRGSNLPGIQKDTVPITFSQVIGNVALWDTEDNVYDKEWYQHTAGFALDLGLDPLNFVGVGVVSSTMKTPAQVMKSAAKAAKGGDKSEDAVSVSRLVRELSNPNLSPKAEKAWRVQQVLARQGDMIHGDALLTEAGAKPFEFTVEYTKNSSPVGNAGTVPEYTNQRFFADTKVTSSELQTQINQLNVQKKDYPGIVALESYKKDLQIISDDLDLGGSIEVPELRVRTVMSQNATKIKIPGLEHVKDLDNLGGMFWQRVLAPLEDATAKWPGHKSQTRFAEFTDEAGNTRLTQKAAAARRALDEEEVHYRVGNTVVPDEVALRWEKALDEAGDIDPNTGKPSMWQEYDVQHYLDEGAPGLIPEGGWSPLKAYAKSVNMTPEAYARATGFTDTDIIRSLVRGPEILKKAEPEYAAKIENAAGRIHFSKEKIKSAKTVAAKEAAARALQMAYRDMSQATLEGSFRYLDGLSKGPSGSIGAGFQKDEIGIIDDFLTDAGADLEKSYSPTDELGDYYGSFGTDAKGDVTFSNEGLNGSYRDINLDDFKSYREALDSVPADQFTNKSAQIQAFIDELETQKSTAKGISFSKGTEVYHLPQAQVIELDQMLPMQSQFRKANGDFDYEAISSRLEYNKDDLAQDNTGMPKVTYQLPRPKNDDPVAVARWQREARFLDVIAKEVEQQADDLFRKYKTEKVNSKTSKVPNEAVQALEDERSLFWTKGKEGREGPAVRKLGPKPTRKDLEAEHPVTFKHERASSQAARNKSRNPDESIDVHQETGTHQKVKWDAATGMGKTAAERRIEAIVKGKQRRWEKARKTAQETDAARFAALKKELSELKASNKDYQLNLKEIQDVYKSAYTDAKKGVLDSANDSKTLLARGANSRMTVGDTAAALQKQASDRIKFEELRLKIAKAETDIPEELAIIEKKRKALIKKKIALYDRVKKAKMEANSTRITMMHRVGEEELMQALMMPERIDSRALQIQIMGMKKTLQFTSGMFKGAQFAEQFLPASVWASFQDNWVRPTKQLDTIEGIEARAAWEGKTPVVIHSLQKRLTKAMDNTTESERSGMLMAYRKGIPYGGPKQLEFQRVAQTLDEIMDVINGKHPSYMFKRTGRAEAEALSLPEILRFLPKGYAFNMRVLNRSEARVGRTKPQVKRTTPVRTEAQEEAWIDLRDIAESGDYPFTTKQLNYMYDLGGDADLISNFQTHGQISNYIDELKGQPKTTAPDPFSPIPEARSEFSFDDLMNAIESNGVATPKDLIDPFRVAWVYNLAAGQASSFRAFTKTVGESFGVTKPQSPEKIKLWNDLARKHNWQGFNDIPDVLFPPEAVNEVKTLMKFTQPGPEQEAITKLLDQAIGYWKQGMTIYNPAYYTRNGIGEIMVSWLDGVNSPKWYRMAGRINKYAKKTDQDMADLVNKYDVLEGKIPVDVAKGNEVLFTLRGGLKVRIEDVYKEYVDLGLMATFANTDIGRGVRGLANQSLSSNPIRRGTAKVNSKVHEKGEGFEDYLRLAHFMHAMEKSGKGSLKEAASYAATRVRRSHFDYTDFSDFEKTVMLRVFPFYKWIRRGAPLMMQHLFMTPGKMLVAPKAMDYMSNMGLDPMNAFNEGPVLDTQDVYEDKNGYLPNYTGIAPAWIRDLFAYQMQPAADDEYANFFRLSLPQFDGLQGLLSFGEGNFNDSTAATLLNPLIKAPIELANNQRLDPDSNFEIVGGEYNENMGISDKEATGAYLAQQANPITAFLAKLSKNGKLPVGNISDQESGRDATRDVASFFTGAGLYQSKLGFNGSVPESPSAVGQYESLSEAPQLSGLAALRMGVDKNQASIKKLVEANTNTTSGEDTTGDSAKGWIDGKYDNKGKKKSGWIPNKYGKSSRGYSSGFSGSSSSVSDLMALLMSLREEIDQGRVINTEGFTDGTR